MSDTSTALALNDLPIATRNTSAVATITKDGKRLQIGRKLKAVLDTIVWEGKRWDEAARTKQFAVRAMRKALERPHVRKYLEEQKQVFRASVSAQNIHRAAQIRDQDDNKTAAVQAMRYLDNIEDAHTTSGAGGATKPGVVIIVNAHRPVPELSGTVIEINPTAMTDDSER